jgi:DNA-binding NtrC family response regulator
LSAQAAADSTVQRTVDKDPENWVGGLLTRLKSSETGNLEEVMADLEKRLIRQALAHRQGDREKTAEDLGLSYRALKYKITKYGIRSRKGKSLPPAADSGDEGKDLR